MLLVNRAWWSSCISFWPQRRTAVTRCPRAWTWSFQLSDHENRSGRSNRTLPGTVRALRLRERSGHARADAINTAAAGARLCGHLAARRWLEFSSPAWIRMEHPITAQLIRSLRDVPCDSVSCSYCRTVHNPEQQLRRFFGWTAFAPLPPARPVAACNGRSSTRAFATTLY